MTSPLLSEPRPDTVPPLNTEHEKLDYPLSYVHRGPWDSSGPYYVNRACEGGCQRTLKFSPLPGWKRFQQCSVCKRVTSWRLAE